jgi:O-Antigen ligase
VHRPAPAAAVPFVLVPALGVTQGGFLPGAWVWAGALAAWAVALAVVFDDDVGVLGRAWPWLLFGCGLLAWTAASTAWSVRGTQSILDARRTLCYTAVILALVALARRGADRTLVVVTHAAVTFVIVYALAGYLLGSRKPLEFEGYTLSDPLGYANAVGILAALGILLGLGICALSMSALARAASAATVPVLALALELSNSTGSWVALALGLCVALVLAQSPSNFMRAAAAAAVPAGVSVALAWRSGLSTLAVPRFDGLVVALAAVGCAVLAGALGASLTRSPSWTRPWTRALLTCAVLVVGVAMAGLVAYGRGSQPRASYYEVAWHQYRAHPVLGAGAGTFAYYWANSGKVVSEGGALDAHSLYLETLAELGPVGLVLLLMLLVYPLRLAVRFRDARYVPPAAAAYVAFLAHAGLDWDWEMPVVVVAALSLGGALIASSPSEDAPPKASARAAILVVSLALGGFAIAGARSHGEPAAAPQKEGAPPTRSPLVQTQIEIRYGLP